MGTKICIKCSLRKSLDEFYINKGCKDGRLTICKVCHLAYCKEQRKNNKACIAEQKKKERQDKISELDKIKRMLGCLICGTKEGLLDAHHWEDNKEFKVSVGGLFNKERLRAEFEKCHVLCHSCHPKVHRVLRGHCITDPPPEFENYMLEFYDIALEEAGI